MLKFIKWHRSNHGICPTYESIKVHFSHLPESQIDTILTNLLNDGSIQVATDNKNITRFEVV